jgi:hypothetical protein
MKLSILSMLTLTIFFSSNAYSQALNLLNCSSQGFTYNELTVVDDHYNLHFETSGLSLKVVSDHIPSGHNKGSIRFSVPKENCDLSELDEQEMACTFKSLQLHIDTDEGTIVEEIRNSSLILKRTPQFSLGIKLLLISETAQDHLVLSNRFTSCR